MASPREYGGFIIFTFTVTGEGIVALAVLMIIIMYGIVPKRKTIFIQIVRHVVLFFDPPITNR
jgi:hypothetical protein